MRMLVSALLALTLLAGPALALDRPWISAVYFYWYSWDYKREWGGWEGGVYNTPLGGYYDSARYADNLRELHQTAEWGLTHHFMDYWGPGWRDETGEKPREDLLMRATEELQERGYDLFMSVYQDGTDFDMAEFAKNLDPGRHCEFYVKNYGASPAQPKLNGKPVYLIYGRNGSPKITGNDEGFRAWLQRTYPTIEALNKRWGTDFASFADVKFDLNARGHQRAESIRYQFNLWADEMERTNIAAQQRFGLPGCVFSWDVGYGPFYGYGYSDQARVFCGPHSYGGIFGKPHDQDVERFIQAAVAKRYQTVFFDTFKNFYHDWEIRIPGTCYPPDFAAFDRFWVQALSHYSEALLHLSWNEWWEGSNLEPCYEYGKTYCEKNLLYATIMKQCFDSIRNWNAGAKVAVLLNDWHWLSGGRHPEDIYACIQALRRNNIRFDLLPDDFVTAEELNKFDVVIAPSGSAGFGYNTADRPILDVLLEWAKDPRHKLLIDDFPEAMTALKLSAAPPAPGVTETGPDMNVFVDVGEEGDERFLIDGCSGREDWGKLPADKFGATDRKYTVRWTPATGTATSFMLPFSPNRDHVLRLAGSALWENHVTVLIDGEPAAEFDVKPNRNDYEVNIPAQAVNGRAFGELQLRYARANVPKELAPARFEYETRVCNLAIDWLQLATAGTPFSTEQKYKLPEAGTNLAADAPGRLAGKRFVGTYTRHLRLAATGKVLSTHAADGVPRDMVLGEGGNILFVNGLFSSIEDRAYLDGLLCDWAGCERQIARPSDDIIVTPLRAGDTDILLAYNYAPEGRMYSILPPSRPDALPVVEVRVLSQDGSFGEDHNLPVDYAASFYGPAQFINYYGVYQVTRGRVALETPQEMSLVPGQTETLGLIVSGRFVPEGETAVGTLKLISHLPSLTSDTVEFKVGPRERVSVPLAITARDDIDWGRKSVIFDVEVAGRHSYFWRTITIKRLPDLQVTGPVVDARDPQVNVAAVPFPWAQDAVASNVRVTVADQEPVVAERIPPGESRQVKPAPHDKPRPEAPVLLQVPVVLDYTVGGKLLQSRLTMAAADYPEVFPRAPDAIAPMIVCNPLDQHLENFLVSTGPLEEKLLADRRLYVRERSGSVVPSQLVDDRLLFIAMLPPQSARLYYLCAGDAQQPTTDLVVSEGPDGVTVSNSRFTLGWTGQQGGTVTLFRSRTTGRDYAAGSFGTGFGTWGKYDPQSPAINTINFVSQEQKTWQRDATEPAEVRVTSRGPVVAVVEVAAKYAGAEAWQTYWIPAYQSDFTVSSRLRTPEAAEEAVALDIRLARNGFTKIFPNFTGIPEGFAGDSPSAGWREATYVPRYATFMTPDRFEESISVFPLEEAGITPTGKCKFRQGFWPAKRPQAGPVNYAEIELIAKETNAASARVLFHSGHQAVARRFREGPMDNPPTVIILRAFQWDGELTATGVPPDWWSPYWHFRVPVLAGPLDASMPNPVISFPVDFDALLAGRGKLDAGSLRTVVPAPRGPAVLPTYQDPESGQVVVTLTDTAWPTPAATREFWLYFDTLENGPKQAPARPETGFATQLLNGGCERHGEHWQIGPGAQVTEDAHTGEGALRLEFREGAPVVVANSTMRIRPESKYRVTFWAKTSTPGATVRTNYYSGASYDFPQFAIALRADGQWHQYEQVLPTGQFPYGVNPMLRFWLLGTPQAVTLDDIAVEEIEVAKRAPTPVKVGPVEAR